MGTWLPDRQKPANSESWHKPALQWFGGGKSFRDTGVLARGGGQVREVEVYLGANVGWDQA
ncbi:MAG: hypothetical protein JWQ42_3869 [Edaphobacter sp.]|nr:hypothetical protein [Edaphobacter sp.]